MGFWSWLFGKKEKKLGEDDGQAQYFKEDFDSKTKKSSSKKAEATIEDIAEEQEIKEQKDEKVIKPKAKKPSERIQKETTGNKTVKSTKAKVKTKAESTEELVEDSPEVKNADTVKESKATPNGKFDIRKAKDGRFFFSLYASNGAVIAYSQIYSSLTAVNTGMSSVINNMDKAEVEDTTLKKFTALPCPKWEIYIDKAGEYRFRLYATNGQCVCHSSHGYSTKSGCKGGIESIRRFAKEAKVDKSYLK